MAAMDTSGVLDLFAAPGSAAAGAAAVAEAGGPGPSDAAAEAAAAGAGAAPKKGAGGALQKLLNAVGELHDDEAQYEGLSVAAFASKLQQQGGAG